MFNSVQNSNSGVHFMSHPVRAVYYRLTTRNAALPWFMFMYCWTQCSRTNSKPHSPWGWWLWIYRNVGQNVPTKMKPPRRARKPRRHRNLHICFGNAVHQDELMWDRFQGFFPHRPRVNHPDADVSQNWQLQESVISVEVCAMYVCYECLKV